MRGVFSMKQISASTQWPQQKILPNLVRLADCDLIEYVLDEENHENAKVKYTVLAKNVTYVEGFVPYNGFSPRVPKTPQKKHKSDEIKVEEIPVSIEIKKRKRTPITISQTAERVNF